ncbi:MAG: glycosyltransferase [Candidatus Omnitrophica bacterium]|nr:glycosyltransferase [Candidatus Omnitrophota bacterium]MBU1869142.1 glycosyltransferase [Candidatus Omnitrophota bacterium]
MQERKLRILFAIPRLANAGTEKHLLNLAKGLAGNGFEVTICCLFNLGMSLDCLGYDNIELVSLNRRSVYDPRIIFDLLRICKKGKFDVLHSYLFAFHYLAVIPAKICGAPIIITTRRELARWKKWHHNFFENLANLFTDKVIACSVAARDFALDTESLTVNKVNVIYNGVDLDVFKPKDKNNIILDEFGLSDKDVVVGMVANFSDIKNHIYFLEGLVEVKKNTPGIKCLLVGDGALRVNIEEAIERLGLVGNVRLAGQRDDVADILSVIDIFVLNSLEEGLPNSILEAMACGLPVVATKVGGVSESVAHGESGLLVSPGALTDLAKAITALAQDKNLRKKMGCRSRAIIESKFSFQRMLEDYIDFYKQGLVCKDKRFDD